MTSAIAHGVPLGPRTTLELGGSAEHFVEVDDLAGLRGALAWADAAGCPVTVLGGGSNVLVADGGVPGLVVAMAIRGLDVHRSGDVLAVRAAAGERWDDVVARTVAHGATGIECLSGIPGSVGATPIQNVGAYGQEIAEVVTRVCALDRSTRELEWVGRERCGFGYRTSVFKRSPGRHVIVEVELALPLARAPSIRYAELARALGDRPLTVTTIRDTVLALRRGKSMVLDAADENRRSVGSFFTNPIVEASVAAQVAGRARAIAPDAVVPSWPQADGRFKLAAAWLIERSGTVRGERDGAVGVSSRHSLALVHHGGGTTRALLGLADRVAGRVRDVFGVDLELEPVRLGDFGSAEGQVHDQTAESGEAERAQGQHRG
jgi:UDP-N-acetylmuramate dehydrogenase